MKISKLLSILLVLVLLLCLLPASALADPEDGKTSDEETVEPVAEEEPAEPVAEEEEAPVPEEEEEAELPVLEEDAAQPLVIGADEVCYPTEGDTVYSNGGTVYNNGGIVYSNGGTVYQNSGTVYNNGGVVYANGGIIYNNGGTVYRNSGTVFTFTDEDILDSHLFGFFRVSTEADYSAFAQLEGLDAEGMLPEGESCTIRVREGVILRSVESSSGVLTENEDGSWSLAKLDSDTVLTLDAQVEAPTFDLEPGCYAEEQTLTISGPEGAEIYYTLDGNPLHMEFYEESLTLSEGCSVSAVAMLPGAEPSETTEADFAFVSITVPELPNGTQGEEPPEAVAFTVDNPGKIDAVIESVSLPGKSATYFRLSTEDGGTVKAGTSDSETWTLRPSANLSKGTYKATVVFTLAGGKTVQCEIPYKVK